MKRLLAHVAGILLLACAIPAHAQWVVTDPANLAQNLLSATRALSQIENQIRQLENDARNLQRLDFDSLGRLRVAFATTQRLFTSARGLSLRISRLEAQFAELYPSTYDESVTRARMNIDRREHWSNSREAFGTSLEVQAQAAENFSDDEAILADLVERSQTAVGALQSVQATNQILALQTRELIQAQQLHIAQNRAVALEHARAMAAEERSRELRRRFMTRSTAYSPESITAFSE